MLVQIKPSRIVINPPFPALVMPCKTRHFLPLYLPLPIKENAIAGILEACYLDVMDNVGIL
jgi:hypothetical protein